MDLINLGSSRIPTRSSNSRRSSRGADEEPIGFRATAILSAPEKVIACQGATKLHRLVANTVLRSRGAIIPGQCRARARVCREPPEQARIDPQSGRGFRLDATASSALQSELLMGGLLPGWRRRVPSDGVSTIRARMRGRPVVARVPRANRSGVRTARA
jgi:hypothetical protein